MVEERTKYKAKVAGGMVTGVISVAALIFAIRSCKPEPERIPTPPPPVPCPADPVRGDNICDIDRGEHDPMGRFYDPASCGYCGDGNILRDPRDSNQETNALEIRSTDPRASQPQPENGPKRIVCDFDYHCGNGTVDRDALYGVLVRPTVDGGVYSFGYQRVTESCTPNSPNHCPADCGGQTPQPADTRRGGTTRRGGRDTPDQPAVVSRPSGVSCVDEVARPIRTAVASINNDPPGARNAARVRDGEQTSSIQVRYSYTVTPPGNISGGVNLSCAVCTGGSYSVRLPVVSTSETCTVSGSFSVAVQ
jgi:hypothetical protein